MKLWYSIVIFYAQAVLVRSFNSKKSTQNDFYVLVFDAGSTSTRLHFFYISLSSITLEQLLPGDFSVIKATKIGKISPLTDFIEESKQSQISTELKSLIDKGKSVIKELNNTQNKNQTIIFLRGTAGMRSLPIGISQRMIKQITEVFSNITMYVVPSNSVALLNGFEEAFYLWIGGNFLKDTIASRQAEKTSGMLDLGGGSTQITIASDNENTDKLSDVVHTRVLGVPYQIYVKSYENAGREATRIKFFHNQYSVCIRDDETQNYFFRNDNLILNGSPIANHLRFNLCYAMAKSIIFDLGITKIWQENNHNKPLQLHGVSSFFYIIDNVNFLKNNCQSLNNYPCNKTKHFFTLEEIENSAKNYCENLPSKKDYEEIRKIGFICTDLVYILALLKDGYGLDKVEVNFTFSQTLSEIDVSWPLGFALEKVYEIVSSKNSARIKRVDISICIEGLLILLIYQHL